MAVLNFLFIIDQVILERPFVLFVQNRVAARCSCAADSLSARAQRWAFAVNQHHRRKRHEPTSHPTDRKADHF